MKKEKSQYNNQMKKDKNTSNVWEDSISIIFSFILVDCKSKMAAIIELASNIGPQYQ
jgi:hypothetical protein